MGNCTFYPADVLSGSRPVGITRRELNKFFVKKYIDNGPPCTSDVCGPTGDNVYYLFNLNTKKLKEIKASDWFNSTYDYEIIG